VEQKRGRSRNGNVAHSFADVRRQFTRAARKKRKIWFTTSI
jgi:hypothetical protein